MIFSSTITTPANTAKSDSLITFLSVSKGLVYRIEVEFPAGCWGLQHCQIFDGSYQVYPSSRQDSFHSNGFTVGFDDSYLKQIAPFEFRIKTWNLDETYEHKIQVRMGLASSEAFMSRYMPSVSWDKFKEVMLEASLAQERMKQQAILDAGEILGGL